MAAAEAGSRSDTTAAAAAVGDGNNGVEADHCNELLDVKIQRRRQQQTVTSR
jgi:hypothetical protein